MELPERRSGIGWALAGAGLLAVLFALAILLKLGPFAEDELSRGEFIARGDQICEQAHEAFVDLQDAPPRTSREAADLTAQLADIAADERDRIEELEPPSDLSDGVSAYLEARERGIVALERGNDAAEANDSTAYAAQQDELDRAQRERRELAKRVGFSECSRPLAERLRASQP